MTTDKELLEKRIRTEAEIIVANARKKGVVLDLELVVECLKSRVKFDRGMMSFLVKLQAAGKDCNDYLRDLKAERERRPLDEIKKAKNLARLVKNTIESIEVYFKWPDLKPPPDVEALHQLVDKANELIAAHST